MLPQSSYFLSEEATGLKDCLYTEMGPWFRTDSRSAPSQWETSLLCNDVSHWLGTNLESALLIDYRLSYILGTLTHWGRVTHICVSKLTIIGSDNGLLPGRRQAMIWTNAGILLIGPIGTNSSEILIAIHISLYSFMKMHLKLLSAKWRLFCLCLNELKKNPLIHAKNSWDQEAQPGSWCIFMDIHGCYLNST